MSVALPVRSLRQVGLAVLVGSAAGLAALAIGPARALAGALGVGAVVLAFTAPEFVILFFLALVCSVLPSHYNVYLRLAGRGVFLSDLVLLLLLTVAALRLVAEPDLRWLRTPLDAPLLLLLGAAVVGMATAVSARGASLSDTTYEARFLLYYVLFFPVTNLIRTRRQLTRLTWGILIMAGLVAVAITAQAIFGPSALLLEASMLREEGGVFRVYHPGALLILVQLMVVVCGLALPGGSRYRLVGTLMLPLLLVGMLLCLSRNSLAMVGISLAGLLLILPRPRASRLVWGIVVTLLLAAAAAALIVAAGQGDWLLRYLEAFRGRLWRVFSGALLTEEDTLLWRWRELGYAWARLVRSPLLGIGFAVPYREPFYGGDPLTTYVHNAYIWLWLKTGLPGLVAFLWLAVRFVARGLRHWRDVRDESLRALPLAFALAFLGLMASNLVAPIFVQDWSLAVFPLILGLNEVTFALREPLNASASGG